MYYWWKCFYSFQKNLGLFWHVIHIDQQKDLLIQSICISFKLIECEIRFKDMIKKIRYNILRYFQSNTWFSYHIVVFRLLLIFYIKNTFENDILIIVLSKLSYQMQLLPRRKTKMNLKDNEDKPWQKNFFLSHWTYWH